MKEKILEKFYIYAIIYFVVFSLTLMIHAFDFNFSVTVNIIAEMINTFVWPYVILNALNIFIDNYDLDGFIKRFCIMRIVFISILNFFFIDNVGMVEAGICFFLVVLIQNILNDNGYYEKIDKRKKRLKEYKASVLEENKEIVNKLNNKEQLNFEIDRVLNSTGINLKSKYIPKSLLKEYKDFDIIYIIFIFQYICSLFLHINPIVYIFGLIIIIVGYICTRRYKLKKHIEKLYREKPYYDLTSIVKDLEHYLVPNDRYKQYPILLLIGLVLPIMINYSPKFLYKKSFDGYEIKYYIMGIKNTNEIVIPLTHRGTKITTISQKAFSNILLLKEINIPTTITYIGKSAFKNCINLEKVEISNNSIMIDDFAFYNNISLKQIELPNKMSTINIGTFRNCISLEEINIPDTVTEIKPYAFYNNKKLKRVNITNNTKLEYLNSNSFVKCDNLEVTELIQTVEMYNKERQTQ